MNVLALFAAILTILAAGSVCMLVVPLHARPHLFVQLALSWIFGTALVSIFVWILGFFTRAPFLPVLVAMLCIGLGLVYFKMRGRSPVSLQSWRKPQPVELLLSAIIALEIAFVFYLSYVHTLGGDGLLNWEIKARYAFMNAGALPATYFQDAGRATSHPEYPLAIPYTELWLYFWMGETNQFWAKTIFALFYAAGTILLVFFSTRLTGKTWPGLLVAGLFFFIPQISTETGSAIVGYADFPLSVFYLTAIGSLVCACHKQNIASDDGGFSIYAIALGMLPWIKREGSVLWMMGALCGLVVIWRNKKSPLWILALLPGFLLMIGWKFYLSQVHAVSSPDFVPIGLDAFSANIYRLGSIASMLVRELVHTKHWSLFWPATALAGLFFLYRFRGFAAVVAVAGIAGPIAFYTGAYVFSNWPDYHDHVALSLNRLLIHVAPLGAMLVSALLDFIWERPASLPTFPPEATASIQPLEAGLLQTPGPVLSRRSELADV